MRVEDLFEAAGSEAASGPARGPCWAAPAALLAGMVAMRIVAWALIGGAPVFTRGDLLLSKAAYLERHADRYDLVFLGTSVTLRAVVPQVLEEQGIPRAYNAGAAGAGPLGMRYLLRALERAPAPPRLVVFEFAPVRSVPGPGITVPRHLATHDPAGVLLERSLPVAHADHPEGPAAVLRQAGRALGHVLGVGRGFGALQRWLRASARDSRLDLPRSDHGYLAAEQEWGTPGLRNRRRSFLGGAARRSAAARRGYLEGRMAAAGIPEGLTEGRRRVLAEFVTRIRGLGSRPVLLVAPHLHRTPGFPALLSEVARAFPDLPRLDCADALPADVEGLDPTVWFDLLHLRDEGARILSRCLARQLVPLVEAR